MKIKIFIIMVVLLLAICIEGQADIVIDKNTASKIKKILNQPVDVYQLDREAGFKTFEVIDTWVNARMELHKVKKKMFVKKGRKISSLKIKKNLAISDRTIRGVQPSQEFDIYYIQNPNKRRFVKDLVVPARKKMSDETATNLGREFVERNGFCLQTEADKIGSAEVMSLVRQRIKENGPLGEKLIVSQDVIFSRVYRGLEVFNSRQAVGLHPESKEILSYRISNWMPVDERSGRKMIYQDEDIIIDRIQSAYAGSKHRLEISDVSPGMYQAGDKLFPVIRVKVKPRLKEGEPVPTSKTLIIGLIKDLDIGKEKVHSDRKPGKVAEKSNGR